MRSTVNIVRHCLAILSLLTLAACTAVTPQIVSKPFVVAMVPDTQNMVSYRSQRSEGFALDGAAQYLQMMRSIADWRDARGAPLAFVASVGDVWQHQSEVMDADHRARGFKAIDNPYFARALGVTDRVISDEIPLAIKGYQMLGNAGIPFGVAPGNHDHDAMWSAAGWPPQTGLKRSEIRVTPEQLGMLHIGGLNNFRSAFGADKPFFADQSWYIDSFHGGASSAQTFSAGGYQFLHIALEMQPSDEVIRWALGVIDRHRGAPAIISTHDYLNTAGQRLPNPIVDLQLADPGQHNNARQLWDKLLSQRDEILLVLCGHQHGQSRRVDPNKNGNEVHQLLADYQSRGQSALDAGAQPMAPGQRAPAVGDGWFRLLEFDLGGEVPRLRVRTYSSHYGRYASDTPEYAQWYLAQEHPGMTPAQFLAQDEFELKLTDFRSRFGAPARPGQR